MLGNIHSELLCGNPESENMIHFEHHDHGTFVAVCDADDEGIKQRCKNLIKRTGKTNNHFCWNIERNSGEIKQKIYRHKVVQPENGFLFLQMTPISAMRYLELTAFRF